ncbi:hypothetical protein CCMSSC00406_0006608 [Pleurotus cornucopiae]|uniref:Uncharacterized protein n=1 Tax=Pleurotus cornucopiae TaxID=5321 RepID=A0ACB7IQ20_PLECO|nr:hypothetical protein CCMSSC00406_0006608 [Pleurotus cornucopiae]
MSSPPVVLYTGSLHAVPGHEAYPAIDTSIDEPASNALDWLATTITTWPLTTNDTWRFVHSLELPSYHVSFRNLEYYVQLADEAAQAYTNQPLENRVLSIMSSNNTIELLGTGMDSLDFQQGVMLNTSIVSQRLRHPERVPVQQGHLFYTLVSARHLTSIYHAPHAHDPHAMHLGLGSPYPRPSCTVGDDTLNDEVPDSQASEDEENSESYLLALDSSDLNGGINPEYEFMNRMNDSQAEDDNIESPANTTAAVYSKSQPGSRRNSVSSAMSIEDNNGPSEPRI